MMIAAAPWDGFFTHEILEILICAVFHVVSLLPLMDEKVCTGSKKFQLKKCK